MMVFWMKWACLMTVTRRHVHDVFTLEQPVLPDLSIACKSWPQELVSTEGCLRVQALAGQLPEDFSDFWGLECRMLSPEALADVLFEVKNKSLGQRLLAGQAPSCLDALSAEHIAWDRLRAFARLWSQEQEPLFRVPNLWLEFDAQDAASPQAAAGLITRPSIFLGLRSKKMKLHERKELFSQASHVFQLPLPIFEQVHSFIESIPSPGQLFQLGFMLGRPTRDIRVCVNHLAPAQVPGWLSSMNWPGDIQALQELLQRLEPEIKALALGFNLCPHGVENRIGLECYMDWNDQKPEQWGCLLDILDEFSPCHPAKRTGLLAYPGEKPLPAGFRKNSQGAVCLSLFHMIHHIKLSFEQDRVSQVKAYLAVYKPDLSFTDNWYLK